MRKPLFCGTDLAERIERVEAELVAKASAAARARPGGRAGFVRRIAGGIASYAEAGSPFNKVAGLGFAGVPAEDELAEVEQAFHELGAPVGIELPNLADPAIGELLTGRGYRLAAYENVLGAALDGLTVPEPPPGIEVRLRRDDERDATLDLLMEAVDEPDTQGNSVEDDFPRDVLRNAVNDMEEAADTRRYLALIDGVPVGTGAIRMSDGVAHFAGAATVPTYRRRGVQTALIAARLAGALEAGCDIATVTTGPGTKSQQNVQGRGFDLLYTRAILLLVP
jgi:GNAT superfamily N-acetyltransferase